MNRPTVFLSNHIDVLLKSLTTSLFNPEKAPFSNDYIFIPHHSMKKAFLQTLSNDHPEKIAMNMNIVDLGQGISALFHEMTHHHLLFPPQDLISLELEAFLDKPHLAPLLAKEFIKYGKYGGQFIKTSPWPSTWQQKAWDYIFSKWNYPYQLLEKTLQKPNNPIDIHIFNFPFLPTIYHEFFIKISPFVSVTYYQFSPCYTFWSEASSAAELFKTHAHPDLLASASTDGNSLLKNLGRVGRETTRIFEDNERFVINNAHIDFTHQEPSQLSLIKKHILHFEPQSKPTPDESLKLIPAASKMREIEIIHSLLLKSHSQPTDTLIVAPDITRYAPFINLIFGEQHSPFNYTIYDIAQHPLLHTFLSLISLNESRFTKASIYHLFSNPLFTQLSTNDYHTFRKWIDQSGVKWGMSAAHRRTLLPNILDTTESGTWEEAFNILIQQLIALPQTPSEWDLPYISDIDGPLLGRCISLLRTLYADISPLHQAIWDGQTWSSTLSLLINKYLDTSSPEYSSIEQLITLIKNLRGELKFQAIYKYLSNHLKSHQGSASQGSDGITFQTLQPGIFRNYDTIIYLGMDDHSFPRQQRSSSLDLLGNKGDYTPSTSDTDRYLFLETLCSANTHVIITYQNISDDDGKEQSPSVVVEDLYPLVEYHPPFPFHHSYFKSADIYPYHHFETAQRFYNHHNRPPFIPTFCFLNSLVLYKHSTSLPNDNLLLQFAKHPVRFYCHHTLNLRLHYPHTHDEEFSLSPLSTYRLRSNSQSLADAANNGHLPLGRFHDIATRKIMNQTIDHNPYIIKRLTRYADIVAIYPLYLLETINGNNPVLSTDKGATILLDIDHKHALTIYNNYYHLSQTAPSPCIPKLAQPLLMGDAEGLEKLIIKLSEKDPYIRTGFRDSNPSVIIKTWTHTLNAVFKPILEVCNEHF